MKKKHEKDKFITGSVRDSSDGKPSYLLVSPIALLALATHCTEGAKHYGANNWAKGQPLKRIFDSLERHIQSVKLGFDNEKHMSGVIWNAMAFIHTKELIECGDLPKELDDMPKYSAKIRAKLNWNKKK